MRNLTEMLGDTEFDVMRKNRADFPYSGWVNITFQLGKKKGFEIYALFLVAEENIETPILGTNVVQVISKIHSSKELSRVFQTALNDKEDPCVELFINFIKVRR